MPCTTVCSSAVQPPAAITPTRDGGIAATRHTRSGVDGRGLPPPFATPCLLAAHAASVWHRSLRWGLSATEQHAHDLPGLHTHPPVPLTTCNKFLCHLQVCHTLCERETALCEACFRHQTTQSQVFSLSLSSFAKRSSTAGLPYSRVRCPDAEARFYRAWTAPKVTMCARSDGDEPLVIS